MKQTLMPDVARESSHYHIPLDWVGMSNIELPIMFAGQSLPAKADIAINLNTTERGVHMSRLYLALADLSTQQLTPMLLAQILDQCLISHHTQSTQARITIHTEPLFLRPALVSNLEGWRGYPVSIHAQRHHDQLTYSVQFQLSYSSTCPCSAALARALIQQQFDQDFSDEHTLDKARILDWLGSSHGIVATPHSQRSHATISLRVHAHSEEIPLLTWIELGETTLKTAVQTIVKRQDEQAFALANGQNPMFCEDACRMLADAYTKLPHIDGFKIDVVHAESLHAHDAIAHIHHNWDH